MQIWLIGLMRLLYYDATEKVHEILLVHAARVLDSNFARMSPLQAPEGLAATIDLTSQPQHNTAHGVRYTGKLGFHTAVSTRSSFCKLMYRSYENAV